LVSPDLKVLLYNSVTEVHLKKLYDRQIKPGDDIREYLVPGTEDDFLEHFHKAISGERINIKRKIDFELGESIWFTVKYFPVYNTHGGLIGVSFNSTNINQQQIQIDQLKEIAILHSHKIRRPVATMLGIADLIKVSSLGENDRKWFELLRKSILELDSNIHNIVHIASDHK
jgi:hypothetical protein